MKLNWFVGLNMELISSVFLPYLSTCIFFLLQIFVPININDMHWVLAVVDNDKSEVQIYSSFVALSNVSTTVDILVMY